MTVTVAGAGTVAVTVAEAVAVTVTVAGAVTVTVTVAGAVTVTEAVVVTVAEAVTGREPGAQLARTRPGDSRQFHRQGLSQLTRGGSRTG